MELKLFWIGPSSPGKAVPEVDSQTQMVEVGGSGQAEALEFLERIRTAREGEMVSSQWRQSAAAAVSMKTVVVRFADADAAAYYITTTGFIGVSRRTRRSDAASDAASCVNETNKS
ncbi:hypothetical protein Bca101_075913 [Brassica carinata]